MTDLHSQASKLGIRLPGDPEPPRKAVTASPEVLERRRDRRSAQAVGPEAARASRRRSVEAIAAGRTGLSVTAYRARVAAGEKWCSGHRCWHPRDRFGRDVSRVSGLAASCITYRRRTKARERKASAEGGDAHDLTPPEPRPETTRREGTHT